MARLLAQPLLFYQDANGRPLPGALCNVYLSGTSNPTVVYQDASLTIPHANPIVALTDGYFPPIYGQPGVDLKLVLTDSSGAKPKTIDPATIFVLTQDDIGATLYPQTLTEEINQLDPVSPIYPPGHIFRFMTASQIASVLSRDQTQNVTQALLNAIRSVGTDSASIQGTTTYTGAEVYLPAGTYLIDHSVITVTTIGLILQGEGAQLYNDYKIPATIIIVDGTNSGNLSFVFEAKMTENARGLVCRDIAFQYKSTFVGDYFKWGAAGVTFQNCSFSSNSLQGGVQRPTSCNSFLRMFNGHHYRLQGCSFSDAKNAILIDNATAANTNGWLIHGCSFYDFSDSFITVTGSGSLGLDIAACDFDPINNKPAKGLVLTAVGFDIHGCSFAGSNNADCPAASWIEINGDGVIQGNSFIFQPQITGAAIAAIIVTGGNVQVSNNRISCNQGLIAMSAGSVSGGGNYYNFTAGTGSIAVQLNQDSTSYVNIGPDTISAGFANSYKLGGGGLISGEVHYCVGTDSSTNGPTFSNGSGGHHLAPTSALVDTTTTGTLTVKQTGTVFAPAGAPTFTLPSSAAAAGGLRYRFLKNSSGNFVINAGAGVVISAGASVASSISNTTTEVGAWINLFYIDSGRVVIDGSYGTWA